MGRKTSALLPATERLAQGLGERLRLARLRRKLTALQVCERAGMSPMTLRALERGSTGATLGAYLAVMQALGMQNQLELLAKDDPLGRTLQDIEFTKSRRENFSEAVNQPKLPNQAQTPYPDAPSATVATLGVADSAVGRPSNADGFTTDDLMGLFQHSEPSVPSDTSSDKSSDVKGKK